MTVEIVVVGSINHDVTALTPRLPRPGETVLGHGHYAGPGGKGANQAVAAARAGSAPLLIGMVGDDAEGQSMLGRLRAEGVDVSGVGVDEDGATGLAVITVDDEAENTIVVSPGANHGLTPPCLAAHAESLSAAGVVLAQLEIPIETVMAAAEATRGIFCLNPAPADELPESLLREVGVLVPNRTELGVIAGTGTPSTIEDVAEAARTIEGPKAFVVTLGAEGALVLEDDVATHVRSPEVDAIDPTGAGDAFCGTLAVELARGRDLASAARRAAVAGALAATRAGAIDAMPTVEEIDEAAAR